MNSGLPASGLPICCNPDAYHLLARQLPALNAPDALLVGAVAIARHQIRDVDAAHVDQVIQDHANKVRSRVRSTAQRQALLAHLHEQGFVAAPEPIEHGDTLETVSFVPGTAGEYPTTFYCPARPASGRRPWR